jgi:chromosomal replication initiator protein
MNLETFGLHAVETVVPPCCPLCGAPTRTRLLMAHIQHVVASYYGIPVQTMVSAQRGRKYAWPRQFAMYLAHDLTPHSLVEIGRRFGFRDHTTVIHAIKAVQKRIDLIDEYAVDYLVLRERLVVPQEEQPQ